jgi:hypothetical protein
MKIRNYLDKLTWEYTQLCQRDNGSIYGIASGKQCRKGKPISYNPNLAKQVREKEKAKIATIVGKAKAIGLTNKDIKAIGEEVKSELQIKNITGKDAIKLFAKKANQLSNSKSNNKIKDSNIVFEKDKKTGFQVPKPLEGYDIEFVIEDPDLWDRSLGGGAMGEVFESLYPPPGVVKFGKIGKYEAESLGRLKGTGVAPEFYAVVYEEKPKENFLVPSAEGYMAMSKIQGKTLSVSKFKNEAERESTHRAYIQARKTIHTNGIAHNDMHDGNAIVKDDGSISLIDFGLAQVGYKFALLEAMGAANGGDWQYQNMIDGFFDGGVPKFNGEGASNKTLVSNIQSAKNYMKKNLGLDWEDLDLGTLSSEEEISSTPLVNLDDDQIRKILDIVYEGF